MKELPEKIELSFETNEGFEHLKSDDDLIKELIDGFNQLIDYLEGEK